MEPYVPEDVVPGVNEMVGVESGVRRDRDLIGGGFVRHGKYGGVATGATERTDGRKGGEIDGSRSRWKELEYHRFSV